MCLLEWEFEAFRKKILTDSFGTATIRIEKGTTDRRLVQYQITKKVTFLGGGGYFFVFLIISNNNVIIIPNNVTTILSIIRTIDRISKALIRIPSFLRFLMYIRFQQIQRESSLCSMEGLTAYRIMVAPCI